MNDGLKDNHRQAVVAALSANPRVERVVLFGSRAMGTFTTNSDVDLALFGDDLTLDDQARLTHQIGDLPMPQQVDLLLHTRVKSKELLEHIRQHGIEWYRKNTKSPTPAPGKVQRTSAMAGNGWATMPFDQAVEVNPSVPLQRGTVYPFVDMQAVDPGSRSVGFSEMREFTGGGSRFMDGDTLMARITPCLENGKIARFAAPDNEPIGHGSTEFIVIRGKPNVTDNGFAYYLTKWDGVRQYYISQMTGSSGRQRVPMTALSHREVAIPPLKEQKAIAGILGSLDDKIELNRRMNETLEGHRHGRTVGRGAAWPAARRIHPLGRPYGRLGRERLPGLLHGQSVQKGRHGR